MLGDRYNTPHNIAKRIVTAIRLPKCMIMLRNLEHMVMNEMKLLRIENSLFFLINTTRNEWTWYI